MSFGPNLWRALAGTLLTLAILSLAGGYAGFLHPLGDSLAVLRPLAIIGVLSAAVIVSLAGMQLASFAATLLAFICGLQVFLAYTVQGPPGRVTLYQKNLLFSSDGLVALEADIRAVDPLVITLQEVSEPNLALLSALSDRFAAQQICPWRSVGGVAVASQLPMVEGTGFCGPGLAAMQVMGKDQAFWVVSIHLSWPWPHDQADQIAALLPVLDRLDGPIVMAGDFNMVIWAHGLRKLAAVTGTVAAGPTMGTYIGFEPWIRLPIDHVFAPSGGRTKLRPAFGSDHLGIVAKVEL